MDDRERHYRVRVANALGACQLLESELKEYLRVAFDLSQKRGEAPPFSPRDKHERSPLGPLTAVFGRVSANADLQVKLETFAKDRNEVAHQGILRGLDYEGSIDYGAADEAEPWLAQVERKAGELIGAVHYETSKLSVLAYLDPIPDEPATG